MPHKPSHCSGGGNFATWTPNKTCRIIPIKAWWFKGEKCWLISQCYKPVAVVQSLNYDSATPWTQPTRLLCPWDFLGKNTRMGCHFLLQGIFLTQESNPHLLHLLLWQAGSLPAEPLEKPLIPTVFSIMTTRMVIIEKTDDNNCC